MPLKSDDLKTVESYKKGIKTDLPKISAAGNTKFWIYKDIELPTASGGKQKLPVFISLVDDVAVKAVFKGKQPVCHGTCGYESSGKIAFDAAQGEVPFSAMAKMIPLLLGKAVHVPAGADTDAGNPAPQSSVAGAPQPQAPHALASPDGHAPMPPTAPHSPGGLSASQPNAPKPPNQPAQPQAAGAPKPPQQPAQHPAGTSPQANEQVPQAHFRGEAAQWPKEFSQQDWVQATKTFMDTHRNAIKATLTTTTLLKEVRGHLRTILKDAESNRQLYSSRRFGNPQLDRHLLMFYSNVVNCGKDYLRQAQIYDQEMRELHKRINLPVTDPTIETAFKNKSDSPSSDVRQAFDFWKNYVGDGNGAPPLHL